MAASAPPRAPAAAGRFYAADPGELAAEVDALLARAAAPPPRGRLRALVVPHAGHVYSGAAAAAAYAAADPAEVDTVLMVGAGHNVRVEGAALYAGPYATPLGAVPYDAALGEALRAASRLVRANAAAHAGEHSIEVNLPFVQRRFPRARLAALVMNTDDAAAVDAVAAALAAAARGRRALLVASSDLSHYPPADVADRADPSSLAALAALDAGFFRKANRLLMARRPPGLVCAWCGESAVAAVAQAARALGADRLQVLARFTSADAETGGERGRCVGYAGAALLDTGAGAPPSPYALGDADRRALLAAARAALTRRLAGEAPEPPELSERPAFNLPAALFVTLETREGDAWSLRGCVGSVEARETLLDAARRYALAAAFEDARFEPLTREELGRLRVEISLLSPARRSVRAEEVRPGVDGVVVEKGGRGGVFLPQVWEVYPERETFLRELCARKAGLPPSAAEDGSARLSVFSVESFAETG